MRPSPVGQCVGCRNAQPSGGSDSSPEQITSKAEAEAEAVIAEAQKQERLILGNAEAEAEKLKNELIDKIAKL